MRICARLLAVSLIATPMSAATAQSTATAQQPQQSTPGVIVKGKKEKKVCKTFDAPTGSHIGDQRICKSKAEWDQEEQMAQRTVDRENARYQAERAQIENEKNGFARKMPH